MRLLGIYVPTPRWSKHGWWRWTVTLLGIALIGVGLLVMTHQH